jgi:tRNA-dihydrouridine synthase A
MMDWTDRHCRFFHRLITRHTRLYTEMVTTGALLHGDVPRHLDYSAIEHPLALQLGGSEPANLAHCAKLAEQWGYDEVNLNCGCPSERVQRGAFGACLMAEPELVADGVKAMRDATSLPVTVKHRIGIDRTEHYGFVRDFVGTVSQRGGCEVFIVHARNAWLQGISPKQNRELPPLRYGVVQQLKTDFPDLTFVLNGGVANDEVIAEQLLAGLDGVMLGRHAYHQPWAMADWDARFLSSAIGEAALEVHITSSTAQPAGPAQATLRADRDGVEVAMVQYLERLAAQGQDWRQASRHMLGLRHGQAGARLWRQVWSDASLRHEKPAHVHRLAMAALARGQRETAAVTEPVL